ncbi:MAG: amidohydrolase family protein [Holophagaceae bacterium]|nr:amidohydrolase family protein [Holophagaceae bacterium]
MDRPVAFMDVAVLPMDSERRLEHQVVVVQAGRITALGPLGRVRVPRNALRVRGAGRTLLPGLTDTHVHLATPTELPLYLVNGVTTVFNLDGRPAHLHWRQQVEEGRRLGPRILSAGPTFSEAMTPAAAKAKVDAIAAAGYDAVKIYNQVGREEYPALIAEAKSKGLLIMGHVPRKPGFEATMAAGQSLAHAEEIVYTAFNPGVEETFGLAALDEAKLPAVARRVAESGVSVTLTLTCFHDIDRQARDLDAFLKGPNIGYLPAWIQAGLRPGANRYHGRYNPTDLAFIHAAYPFQAKLAKALSDAGVPLMTGTDATNIGPVAGFSLHQELEELVAAGLTPFQALRAATTAPAAYFRRPGEFGMVAPGQRADLLLVDGDPLKDIRRVRALEGVMAKGRWTDKAGLASLLAAVPAAHAALRAGLVADFATDPVTAGRRLGEEDPLGLLGGDVLAEVMTREGAGVYGRILDVLRQADPASPLLKEEVGNNLGYALLQRRAFTQALAVFRRVCTDFPRSANAEDSLAEGLAKSGDVPGGRAHYRRALELDPAYGNAAEARKWLEAHPD